jgi:chromosome segregation protein
MYTSFRTDLATELQRGAENAALVETLRAEAVNALRVQVAKDDAASAAIRQVESELRTARELLQKGSLRRTDADAVREAHEAERARHAEESALVAAKMQELESELDAVRAAAASPPRVVDAKANADAVVHPCARALFDDAVRRTEESTTRVEALAGRVESKRGQLESQLRAAAAALERLEQQRRHRASDFAAQREREGELAARAQRDAGEVRRLAADLAATTKLSDARRSKIALLATRDAELQRAVRVASEKLAQETALRREAMEELARHERALEELRQSEGALKELVERSRSEVVQLRSEVVQLRSSAAAAPVAAALPLIVAAATTPAATAAAAASDVAAPPRERPTSPLSPPARAMAVDAACVCGAADSALMVTCIACRRMFHGQCSGLADVKLAEVAMGGKGDFTCKPCVLAGLGSDSD